MSEFRFYELFYEALKSLDTSEQRSEFVMALCASAFDGEAPHFNDKLAKFAYQLAIAQTASISRRQAPDDVIEPGPYLTVREVAEALGVSNKTVYRMIADGQLKAVRIRNAWRISAEELERKTDGTK